MIKCGDIVIVLSNYSKKPPRQRGGSFYWSSRRSSVKKRNLCFLKSSLMELTMFSLSRQIMLRKRIVEIKKIENKHQP
jgi:hypothetical protein